MGTKRPKPLWRKHRDSETKANTPKNLGLVFCPKTTCEIYHVSDRGILLDKLKCTSPWGNQSFDQSQRHTKCINKNVQKRSQHVSSLTWLMVEPAEEVKGGLSSFLAIYRQIRDTCYRSKRLQRWILQNFAHSYFQPAFGVFLINQETFHCSGYESVQFSRSTDNKKHFHLNSFF